jgi:hypothetical protein
MRIWYHREISVLAAKSSKSDEFLNVSAAIGLDRRLTYMYPNMLPLHGSCALPCILLFIAFASPCFSPHSHGCPKVTAMTKASKLFSCSHPMMGNKTFVIAC